MSKKNQQDNRPVINIDTATTPQPRNVGFVRIKEFAVLDGPFAVDAVAQVVTFHSGHGAMKLRRGDA